MDASCKTLQLALSVESRNGNGITCRRDSSPDTRSAGTILKNGNAHCPSDMEKEEGCVRKVTVAKNVNGKFIVQYDKPNTVDCIQTANECCNQKVTFMISQCQNGNVYCENAVCPSHAGIVKNSGDCPNFEQEETFVIKSVNLSNRRLSSVSSDDMVIRSDSFVLHESAQLLSASLLEDCSDAHFDAGMLSNLHPDVCKSVVKTISAVDDHTTHPELGTTFIQPGNHTFIMEEDVFQMISDSLGEPKRLGESRVLHLANDQFICTTPTEKRSHMECLKPNHSTPAEDKPCEIPLFGEMDKSGNVQSSTPSSFGAKNFCLPSLSDSSLTKENADSESPMVQITAKQSTTVKQKLKTPSSAPPKSNKSDNRKLVKPDFSSIKSKIWSRPITVSKSSSETVAKASSNNITHQVSKTQTKKTAFVKSKEYSSNSHSEDSSKATPAVSINSKQDQSRVTKQSWPSTLQDGSLASKSHPRTLSETTSSLKSSVSKPQVKRNSSVMAVKNLIGLTKLGKEEKRVNGTFSLWKNPQKKILKTDGEPADAARGDCDKKGLCPKPVVCRTGGTTPGRNSAVSPWPKSLTASKSKPGTVVKNSSITDVASPRSKLGTSGGTTNMCVSNSRGIEGLRITDAGTHQNGSTSKLPVKSRVQLKSSGAISGPNKMNLEPSVGCTPSNRNSRQVIPQSLPSRASALGKGSKNSLPQASLRPAVSVQKSSVPFRPLRSNSTSSVDKNKTKVKSQSQQQGPSNSHPDLVPDEDKPQRLDCYKALCQKKNQTIQSLKNSLLEDNRRFEAMTVVVGTLHTQHEAEVKHSRELSAELLNLREELVTSVESCERLGKEKDELHSAFNGVLQKVQEQHRSDLADLEDRLKTFYLSKWEKVHQEEADKYKAQMKQQLEELSAKHEALLTDLEARHEERVESLKQHYEETFEELRQSHEQEMQALKRSQKDAEAAMSKDSHTLYLEQELESLKVVLDIKNKQIHQQDKKLLQIEKLMERNVKLDECLVKVQQENEDLKARMDKHARISRQLSTEQAVLQESLQKETKVNKRLSMENEELMWKLHNGDLGSLRRTSPTSSP